MKYVSEMPAALAEAYRVLRPGGRLLVVDTDWDSIVWRSSDVGRMRRVLAAWDEHLVDPYLPRRLTGLLEEAGFRVARREVLPILNVGYDPQTFSAGVITFVVRFVPGHRGVSEAHAQAWAADLTGLGRDTSSVSTATCSWRSSDPAQPRPLHRHQTHPSRALTEA